MHLSASWVIQFHDSPCVFKDIRFELGQAEGQAAHAAHAAEGWGAIP